VVDQTLRPCAHCGAASSHRFAHGWREGRRDGATTATPLWTGWRALGPGRIPRSRGLFFHSSGVKERLQGDADGRPVDRGIVGFLRRLGESGRAAPGTGRATTLREGSCKKRRVTPSIARCKTRWVPMQSDTRVV